MVVPIDGGQRIALGEFVLEGGLGQDPKPDVLTKLSTFAVGNIGTPSWGAIGAGLAVALKEQKLNPIQIGAWAILGGGLGYLTRDMWKRPVNLGLLSFLTAWLLHGKRAGPMEGRLWPKRKPRKERPLAWIEEPKKAAAPEPDLPRFRSQY